MTKRFLDKNDIEYNTIDITENAEALEMVLGMGFASAPVVITENDSWAGFQPEKLEQLTK